MKVWSKTLTPGDLADAAGRVNVEFPGCAVYLQDPPIVHHGPRVRRLDSVHLRSRFCRYCPNPGTGTRNYEGHLAASWTEWGWFLARVFEQDPDARCGDYRGEADFHAQTGGRFIEPRTPRERQLVPHKLKSVA